MKIGKDYTLRKSDRRSAWQKTGEALGLDGDETVVRAEWLASEVPNALEAAAISIPPEFSGSEVVEVLLERVESRARACARVPAAIGIPRTTPNVTADRASEAPPIVDLLKPSPHQALEPAESGDTETCRKIVRQTNKPCLLPASHKGRCRSVLPG